MRRLHGSTFEFCSFLVDISGRADANLFADHYVGSGRITRHRFVQAHQADFVRRGDNDMEELEDAWSIGKSHDVPITYLRAHFLTATESLLTTTQLSQAKRAPPDLETNRWPHGFPLPSLLFPYD